MEQSDEEDKQQIPHQRNLIEEALKILNEEGFTLPNDVVDTLETVGRSNPRRRGPPLRSHRVCEVQSNTRRMRNAREATRRSSSQESSDAEEGGGGGGGGGDVDGDGRGGGGGSGGSGGGGGNTRQESSQSTNASQNNMFSKTETMSEKSDHTVESEKSSESGSTCTASTVKEARGTDRVPFTRQDSDSSLASSASSYQRKLAQLDDGRSSDTGYSTSIENAMQAHEARADNLKNYTKHMENKLSEKQKLNTGLRREISRDSGFTELGTATPDCMTPQIESPAEISTPPATSPAENDTRDFRDVNVSNSDVSERIISTSAGEAHQVTSSESNLTAAEMVQRNNTMTEDGTAVSTAAKLENQEYTSGLSRVTNKVTQDEVSMDEEHQMENRRTKSSRNDTISTTADGVTTASSRHAASMDQELGSEKAVMTVSGDGRKTTSEMEVTQKLSREQEMNNIEQSDDGTSKTESKQVSEKAAMSKSHREEQLTSEDGLTTGVISGSQHQESNAKTSHDEENLTSADGSVCKRSHDSKSSSSSHTSSTEQKTVKQNPYGGASSSELVKKSDSSSSSKLSSSVNQVKEDFGGRSEMSHTEDSNSASNSFSGLCESTDVIGDMKVHRSKSSEQSSESKMKSSKSSSTYSSKSNDSIDDYHYNRRLSDGSTASTLSNLSGLSRENVKPPSYEETVNNLSRQSSLLSRQDSCASSIASSASALNERMRQKRLAEAEAASVSSGDSQTRLKHVIDSNYDNRQSRYDRQNSHSSDSTLSGSVTNNVYENVDGVDYFEDTSNVNRGSYSPRKVEAYKRSSTDPSVRDSVPNRRYTLHDDVELTDRELMEARETVRSRIRGRDDTYIDRQDDVYSDRRYALLGRNNRRREESSFEKEVMDLVDSFFNDDEDDFGFGFSSRRKQAKSSKDFNRRLTSPEYTSDYRGRQPRASQNPYSTREDLSAYSGRDDVGGTVRVSRLSTDYAASDSGYPSSRRYGTDYQTRGEDLMDSVSDSGYNRYSSSSRDDRFTGSEFQSRDNGSSSRKTDNNMCSYSDSNSRHKAYGSAGELLQRAGKSIGSDRNINASISGGGNRRGDYHSINKGKDRGYNSSVNDGNLYKRFAEDTVSDRVNRDMGDGDSSCPSFHSLPPDVYRLQQCQSDRDDLRTQSLPDMSEGKINQDDVHQGTRKERIDTALTWIRSELGNLRTQDRVLLSQFQRCQDSIEQLKKQRPWYEVFSDDDGDDGRHWEDWEIEDYDRSCSNERDVEPARTYVQPPKSGVVFTKERMSFKATK